MCLQGVTGRQCTVCTSNGGGLLPYCESCDECSTQWIDPINELQLSVSSTVTLSQSITQVNITHTELSQGQDLLTPLIDLFTYIKANLSDYNSLLQHTIGTHGNISNLILVIRNLIVRANTVQSSLTNLTNTLEDQRIQLLIIREDLTLLCDLLSLLTSQTNNTTINDLNTYTNRILSSLSSSNQSQQTAQEVIVPLLHESQQQLNSFIVTENQFINASHDIMQLMTVLRNKLQNYQSLLLSADQTLCGNNIEDLVDSLQCGCYGNPERCDSVCGGIGCGQCGRGNCNSTTSELQVTYQLSIKTLNELTQFNTLLQQDILRLMQANTSSSQGDILSAIAYQLSEREHRNATQLGRLISSLALSVNRIINMTLLNVSLIEEQSAQTMSLKLTKTHQEVYIVHHIIYTFYSYE